MTAKELINPAVTPLLQNETVEVALSALEEMNLHHLPVTDGYSLTSLISEGDLLSAGDLQAAISSCKFTLGKVYVTEDQHVYEVIRLFANLDLTLLPVLSAKGQYIGSITQSTLIGNLPAITAVNNPGGIIILEMNAVDYLMTEISQIVESNDARILSMYVTSHADSTKLEVTLKVNRIDIGPVLQSFFRFNYLVKASWAQEDSYAEGLQDRYDALMNYLNI